MLVIDEIRRQVLADRQMVGVALAMGAKGVVLPEVQATLDEFDRALCAEPAALNPERRVLLDALGV